MATEIIENGYYSLLKFAKTFQNTCFVCGDKLTYTRYSNDKGPFYIYECTGCSFTSSFQGIEGKSKFSSNLFYVSYYIDRGTEFCGREYYKIHIELEYDKVFITKSYNYREIDNFSTKIENLDFWLREPAAIFSRLDRLVKLERIEYQEYSYLK